MFNYAIYYIFNGLGFSEELFGWYDREHYDTNRVNTTKTERIGKKYQWIALYNILARISDNNKMIYSWNKESGETLQFEGPWESFVRDFDPTLNQNRISLYRILLLIHLKRSYMQCICLICLVRLLYMITRWCWGRVNFATRRAS